MGDFFADKTYQSMDWISQAVSPWEWDLALAYAEAPEQIDVTPEMILGVVPNLHGWGDHIRAVTIYETTMNLPRDSHGRSIFTSDDAYIADFPELFILDVEPDTTLNAAELALSKPIIARKKQPQLTAEQCQSAAARIARGIISYQISVYGEPAGSERCRRAKEILDLLGQQSHSRSLRNIRNLISNAVVGALAEDRWQVRSMPLAKKIANWIVEYINTGDLSAMANFAKFKVMTHAGQPIYSVQEVE